MKVKKGTTRIALLLPRLGIAVKIPRIDTKQVKGHVRRMLKKPWTIPRRLQRTEAHSLRWHLMNGVSENRREYAFYRETKSDLLEPTYLSLGGILNVQKLGTPMNITDVEFEASMSELLGQEDFYRDPHHFGNPENFCVEPDGKIRMADYAGKRTQEVIRMRGRSLQLDWLHLWHPPLPHSPR